MPRNEKEPQQNFPFREHQSRTGRAIRSKFHLGEPNYARRRFVAAKLLDLPFLFPHEVIEIHNNALERAEQLMQEDYGIVFAITHKDKRDPEEWVKDVSLDTKHLREAEMSAPVGWHQWKFYLPRLGHFFGVTTSRIVTMETIKQHKDYEKAPLLSRGKSFTEHVVFPRIKRQEPNKDAYIDATRRELTDEDMIAGYNDYLRTTAVTLGMPGIVVIAPHSSRKAQFTKFVGNPMTNIINAAKGRGVTKIAFIPVGIGEKGKTEYQVGKYNRGKRDTIEYGECVTLQELDEELTLRNQERNIDEEELTYDSLLEERLRAVAPLGYVK